jgi:hypothetical protein
MSDYEEVDRFAPGDPEDPHGDKATLRQLRAHGADLTRSTNFIHFIGFRMRTVHARAGERSQRNSAAASNYKR